MTQSIGPFVVFEILGLRYRVGRHEMATASRRNSSDFVFPDNGISFGVLPNDKGFPRSDLERPPTCCR